jgi:hypothetical protein
MKILLLIPCITNITNITNINNVITRSELYIYSLHKYLIKYGIEVLIKPYNSDLTMLNTLNIDHTIFINYDGFKNMHLLVEQLKTVTRGAICSLTNTSCYLKSEDIVFCMLMGPNTQCIQNTVFLNYIVDDTLLSSSQDFDGIDILLNSTYKQFIINKVNKTDVTQQTFTSISQFMIKNAGYTDIRVKFITHIGFDIYTYSNNNNNIIKTTKNITKYIDYYEEYSKTNLFFVTSKSQALDGTMLLELALSNVLIIAPVNFVDKKLVSLLDILLYDGINIPWKDIVYKLNDFNIRDKLLKNNNYTWSGSVIPTIIDKLDKFNKSVIIDKSIICDKSIIYDKNIICDKNIISNKSIIPNKKIINNTNNIINNILHTIRDNNEYINTPDRLSVANNDNDNNILKRPVKKILLQSNLLNFIK